MRHLFQKLLDLGAVAGLGRGRRGERRQIGARLRGRRALERGRRFRGARRAEGRVEGRLEVAGGGAEGRKGVFAGLSCAGAGVLAHPALGAAHAGVVRARGAGYRDEARGARWGVRAGAVASGCVLRTRGTRRLRGRRVQRRARAGGALALREHTSQRELVDGALGMRDAAVARQRGRFQDAGTKKRRARATRSRDLHAHARARQHRVKRDPWGVASIDAGDARACTRHVATAKHTWRRQAAQRARERRRDRTTPARRLRAGSRYSQTRGGRANHSAMHLEIVQPASRRRAQRVAGAPMHPISRLDHITRSPAALTAVRKT